MQCPTCGYTFEGTPPSCPQCGVGFAYGQPQQSAQPAQTPAQPAQLPQPQPQQPQLPASSQVQPPQAYYQPQPTQPPQQYYQQPQAGYNPSYYQAQPVVAAAPPPPSGAVPSMVLGIVSIINLLFSPCLAGLSIPISLVLSIIGVVLGHRASGERKSPPATAGLVMNWIGLIISLLLTIGLIALIVTVGDYVNNSGLGYRYLS